MASGSGRLSTLIVSVPIWITQPQQQPHFSALNAITCAFAFGLLFVGEESFWQDEVNGRMVKSKAKLYLIDTPRAF